MLTVLYEPHAKPRRKRRRKPREIIDQCKLNGRSQPFVCSPNIVVWLRASGTAARMRYDETRDVYQLDGIDLDEKGHAALIDQLAAALPPVRVWPMHRFQLALWIARFNGLIPTYNAAPLDTARRTCQVTGGGVGLV